VTTTPATSALIVVDSPEKWHLALPGVEVAAARSYLTDPSYLAGPKRVVFNLCRSYGYQSVGYYVSLLAQARGHRVKPGIGAIQDMRSPVLMRTVTESMSELIKKSLQPIRSDSFVLSIYFGHPIAKRYERLAQTLFNQFEAPLLRARFQKEKDEWQLQHVGPVAASAVPPSHYDIVRSAAAQFFSRGRWAPRRTRQPRFHMAILHDPDEATPPSNAKALDKFIDAARASDIDAELINKNDVGRIGEYDALFLRATTAVNHYTYRLARKAAAEGLVVIDDPQSIVRCSNKVYLAELLGRYNVPTPRTVIVHRDNRDEVARLGFPCVLKRPDSSFSLGVRKVETPEALQDELDQLLEMSELVIAQEFAPSEFDWRIGVFEKKALYACRYFMAKEHWQIVKRDGPEHSYGKVEAVPVYAAPRSVVRIAERAAGLFGDSLYGVDLKQFGRQVRVIEVNDNPSIDAGFEDQFLRRELYDQIMRGFLRRLEQQVR
jgi:glutathione synthase/RimK-type ligase-like ATP-grasp enzyme